MTAKLFVNGIEISVPIGELGEALRQIGEFSTPKQSLPNAQKMDKLPDARAPQVAKQLLLEPSPNNPEDKTAVKFLRMIEDHPLTGVKIDEIMAVLGVSRPKGVGPKSAVMNRIIRAYGFQNVDDVYINPRDPTGERLWKPGPSIRSAIEAIERGLAN
jgi:hypothetical protein